MHLSQLHLVHFHSLGLTKAKVVGDIAVRVSQIGGGMDQTTGAGAAESGATPAEAAYPFETATYLLHLLVAIDRQRDLQLEERMRTLGLTVPRYRAIGVIARFEPCTMSELADYSMVERTTMTRVVDQLVAEGLAERNTTRADRRKVLLNLTPAGRSLYERAVQVIVDLNREMVVGLSEADQHAAIRTEEAILRNLVREPGLADRLMQVRRDAKAD